MPPEINKKKKPVRYLGEVVLRLVLGKTVDYWLLYPMASQRLEKKKKKEVIIAIVCSKHRWDGSSEIDSSSLRSF